MEQQRPSGLIVVTSESVSASLAVPAVPLWQESDEADKRETILSLTDGEGWWSADVRFDGCVHLWRYANEPKGEPGRDDGCDDYMHICDIDDFIARLTELRDRARERFGPEWR
jgi:hypothetical protein